MTNQKELPQYSEEALTEQITIWVTSEYKDRYAKLADRKGPHRLKMAELMRDVMLPEIDRVWEQATGKKTA